MPDTDPLTQEIAAWLVNLAFAAQEVVVATAYACDYGPWIDHKDPNARWLDGALERLETALRAIPVPARARLRAQQEGSET